MAEGLTKVLWLKIHPRYSYWPGDVSWLDKEKALSLAEGEFVEIKIDEWESETEKKTVVPLSEYIKVLWLKPHPRFSYFEGDEALVTPENFTMLNEGGFVQLVEEKKSFTRKILNKLKK